MRVDLDQHALGCVNVHLQQARLVERRVEQRQEALRTKPAQRPRSPQSTG